MLLDSQLAKTENIIGHLVNKYDKKHPEVISAISDHLHNMKPFVLKLNAEKAKSLTEIQTTNQLREALQIAVELELTVMFEYLFACFSVINNSDEVEKKDENSAYYSEIRREYKNQFILICIQEMQHFRMASDMLISIGGVPNLQNVKFPSSYGESHIPTKLSRLNLVSLLRFAKNEEPYPEDLSQPQPKPGFIQFWDKGQDKKEDGFAYLSIAQLYEAIYKGFKTIHEQIGDMMFTMKPNMQPIIQQYTDVDSCLKDITTIETQGEGAGGGKLYYEAIHDLIEWVKNVKFPDSLPEDKKKKGGEFRKDLLEIGQRLLGEIDETLLLLQDVNRAIKLLHEWEDLGLPHPPIDKNKFLDLLKVEPSHWGRFLVMIINYLTLMKAENKNDVDFSALFSRPSIPSPKKEYTEATGKVIKIANTSFHLLLKILEGSMVAISEELNDKYKITQRYNNIRFFPIMTVLIYPLGEILSYFQLSEDEKNYTAGFPFMPNENDSTLVDPLDKFEDVVLTLKMLHDDSLKYFDQDFYKKLDSSVGMWLTDNKAVVKRVSVLLKNVQKTIRVLYLGMTNGLSPQAPPSDKKPTGDKIPSKDIVYTDKYYLNIQFNGRAIFMQASDPDPTFDPRGFSGNMFMYEFPGDPDFDGAFHTQNQNLSPKSKDGKFRRDYVPDAFYEGVKITAAKLVYPCYYDGTEEKNKEMKNVEQLLEKELVNSDFCFYPLENNGVTYWPTFPQLNNAITRHRAVDPVFVGFHTGNFNVRRANLIRNPETKELDASIDFITACLKLSDNFAAYPMILDDRLPKSGGYPQWEDPFQPNPGALSNSNTINANSGTGQFKWDFYTFMTKRCDNIKKDIEEIVKKYSGDPLASLILDFINFYSSKLIVLALMTGIKPEDRNRLSYLCSRYLQMAKIRKSINVDGYFKQLELQYLFQSPLNALVGDYLVAENNSTDPKLKNVEFMTNQDWGLDFWVGGMDYDSLTFFISGSMMIPVTIPTDQT